MSTRKPIQMTLDPRDVRDIQKTLAKMASPAAKRRMLRPAIREASGVVRKDMKRRAPVASGTLKRSIANKVATTRKGDVVGIIGPRANFIDKKAPPPPPKPGFLRRLLGAPKPPKRRIPTNYAHLVEYGHGGRFPAKPSPFMRPAMDAAKGYAGRVIANRLKKELAKEVARQAKRKGRR